jgi:prepilin-type N-terminal cleavage/methylation domain-containing protein
VRQASSRWQVASDKQQISPQSAVRNAQSGDSLVEVLVAVAIISAALVILVASLSTGAFGVRAANRLTTATNLAAAQLETIKGAPYNPAGYPSIDPSRVVVNSQVITTGLQIVTVTVSCEGGDLTVSNYKVDR